ncbi:MAG: hypothetical protein ACE5MH_06410 [Terriglobia bacterium]
MKRLARTALLVLAGVLTFALTVPAQELAEEPAKAPLTEKQVKMLLRENDKQLKQARKAHQRGEIDKLEKRLREYIKSIQRLNEAIAADDIEVDDPEEVLWKVDAAALKQRKLLERLREATAEPLRALVEEAVAAARAGSRAALDGLMRLRAGEFRVGGKRRPGVHQQREEEVWVPGPSGPQRRPRPRPQPPR